MILALSDWWSDFWSSFLVFPLIALAVAAPFLIVMLFDRRK